MSGMAHSTATTFLFSALKFLPSHIPFASELSNKCWSSECPIPADIFQASAAVAKPCSLCPVQVSSPRRRSPWTWGSRYQLTQRSKPWSLSSFREQWLFSCSHKVSYELGGLPPPSALHMFHLISKLFLGRAHRGRLIYSQSNARWSCDSDLNAKEAGKC